ncbi:MAG: DUF5610 domain-containing protein [Hydrogenovibrio sp.]
MTISSVPSGMIAYQKHTSMQSEAYISQQVSQKAETEKTNGSEAAKGANAINNPSIQSQNQASLIAHLFGDSNQAMSDSLKMTFQSTITNLNEILAPDLGENAISMENLEKQGGMEYWTPENTADRILSGATGFLEGFKKSHPGLEGEALMDKFMDVVGGGLQKGFDEAQTILQELKIFEGPIKDNFLATTDLVTKGMENFRRETLGLPSLESEAEASANNKAPTRQDEFEVV